MWDKVEKIINDRNISPKELSEMAGFKNSSTIYSLKNGKIKKPSLI